MVRAKPKKLVQRGMNRGPQGQDGEKLGGGNLGGGWGCGVPVVQGGRVPLLTEKA